VAITQKVFSSRVNNLDSSIYVGETGRLFYEQPAIVGVAPVLKYSDGSTPGGLPLSGSSLTFSGSTPPDNPHDGLLWWDSIDGRLYIYYNNTWVDASPDVQGAVTNIVAGSGISIDTSTGVVTITATVGPDDDTSYITTSSVNTLIANSLTNYATQTWVNEQGFLTSDNDNDYTTTATVNDLIANSLTNYATQLFVTSQGYITTASLSVTTLALGTNALTYNNGVFTFTPSDLSSYATQVYVNSRGFITTNIFTTTNISTFVNDAHYIQNETGVNSVVGTVNQVIVTDLGGRNIRLSTPQNLNTTATVQFGDLTVQNISILGTSTNLVNDIVQGYRLYLASSATNLSQINGGGIQLGNTGTGVHSIFWNADGYWDTDGDGIKTLTLEATTSTLGTLKVLNQARFGYVNQDLTLANAFIQVDSNTNNFSQIAIVNHNTGTSASADIVATNDTGNDSTGFIDMGINSSVFSTSSWTINGANDGYLYVAGGSLAIGTDQVDGEIKTFLGPLDNPTVISVANATTITYSVDLMPSVDAEYLLGRPGQRWKGIYVGTGSVWINDISLGTDAELTVDNGVLYVNGAYQLQVGQLKFVDNTIESITPSVNIQFGYTTDTGNVTLNRNLVLGSSGTAITFYDGSKQLTAWNSTATVQWSQITGTPAIGVTSITTGTGIRVNHSTGTVNISFANDGGYITSAALATYATQTYVNSQGFITSSALSPYTPTSGLGTIIANSLTNYATQTYVTGLGYTTTASVNTLIANSLTNYATQTYVTGLYIEKPNYVTVSSAGTYTASTLTSINILLYTAGSVNVTWTMPPNPIDGQVCKWTNANTQTSVFFISPGVTLIPAISGPYNAGTKFQYVYRSADNKWYACP
jgi:hypothetical protein